MHTNRHLFTLLLCLTAVASTARAAAPAQAPTAQLKNDNEIKLDADGKSVGFEASAVQIDNEGKTLSPTSLKFSDPAKPGRLRLHVMWGDVTITGTDAPEVTIVSNVKNKTVAEKRSDGLRRLDSEITYTAIEKDNVITIDLAGDSSSPAANGATLAITVPRSTSIVVENSLGGDVVVKNLAGDAEIRSVNGEVSLDKISGSALVETMNGEIHATFDKVSDGKPLSFTSMNGEIDVHIPADTKANVRLRTQNGAVLTDFDEKALVTKTEAARGRISRHAHPAPRSAGHSSDEADWHNEVRDAVREAARAGMEAAREAMEAAREATEAAREGLAEAHGGAIPPIPPIPPIMPSPSGGKIVSGTLNGGGPEIQIATMNGTITLRKTQP
jgi:hypothetical protein